jgi:hypothetical protein
MYCNVSCSIISDALNVFCENRNPQTPVIPYGKTGFMYRDSSRLARLYQQHLATFHKRLYDLAGYSLLQASRGSGAATHCLSCNPLLL